MRILKISLFLTLLILSLGTLLLFVIQNMDQSLELGLNLGFLGAWRFAEPQPAVYVILGSFALGAVCVGLFAAYEILLFERRSRRLKNTIRALKGQTPMGAVNEGGQLP